MDDLVPLPPPPLIVYQISSTFVHAVFSRPLPNSTDIAPSALFGKVKLNCTCILLYDDSSYLLRIILLEFIST